MARKTRILKGLEVEKMAAKGKCIAYYGEKVVFLPKTAPGDVVDAKEVKKKKNYIEANPIAYHRLSGHRIEPQCQHFGVCGGCQWQHIPYQMQLDYKQQEVEDALARIGKTELPEIQPIIAADPVFYYRNKMEYTFSSNRWLSREQIDSGENFDRRALGFHKPQSFDKVVQIDHCWLQPDPSNEIRNAIDAYACGQGLTYYNPRNHTGLLRTLMIRTSNTGEVMIVFQFGGEGGYESNQQAVADLLAFIHNRFSQLTSFYYVINPKKNDTLYDLDLQLYSGREYIVEKMEHLTYQVGPKSFYQTNSRQAAHLYHKAVELAGLKGHERVYDLYTGTGTIANFIAHKANRVIGVESVKEAVKDAEINAENNGITNTTFEAGDMRYILNQDFIDRHGQPDIIITDPPRDGMHGDVVQNILDIAPEKIIYISCKPSTQARDIGILSEKYQVNHVQPVDMFPHTHHVENVVQLVRK